MDSHRIEKRPLATPSISRLCGREIVEQLRTQLLAAKTFAMAPKITADEVLISNLRPVPLEDLLGRDLVSADQQLLQAAVADRVVMVTGAGGSIGSELCRQILAAGPARLVLVEQSEFSLYQIEEELRPTATALGIDVVVELASVSNQQAVRRLFQRWRPQSVFHAAAYKHVPMMEKNPIAGTFNNVFSTLYLCQEAEAVQVERFILISTDKAVRPTNVMGATKRICEMILQARAGAGCTTCFAMVRFGNVLGSSGSVVPKFAAQIAAGGPVTVTGYDVTRYFMTIAEAAQLVIQAGAMAEGGDVFVLDMGEPVRIYDLARAMIELSGLSVKDDKHQPGDIEIVEVGLRPGEKRYEELLIGSKPIPTRHPQVIKAHEEFVAWPELAAVLTRLHKRIVAGDDAGVHRIIQRLVVDYAPEQTGI